MVRAGADGLADHSPEAVSIRSRVHEYGGGAMCLVPGRAPGAFAYVDQADQRVWFCDGPAAAAGRATPQPLSAAPPEGDVHNHGGLSATADGDWVVAVREVHREGAAAPTPQHRGAVDARRAAERDHAARRARLLRIPARPSGRRPPGRGRVGSPRHALGRLDDSSCCRWPWSPDRPRGERTLVAAGAPWQVAGGPEESVGQPAWGRDGALRFVSDRRGWWQPYVHPGLADASEEPTALADAAAEFHGPDWVLGQSTMAELADGTVVARMTASGRDTLIRAGTARTIGRAGGTPAGPAVRVDQRAVRARGGAGADREHAGRTGERLGVGAAMGPSNPCARRPTSRSGAPTSRSGSPSR